MAYLLRFFWPADTRVRFSLVFIFSLNLLARILDNLIKLSGKGWVFDGGQLARKARCGFRDK